MKQIKSSVVKELLRTLYEQSREVLDSIPDGESIPVKTNKEGIIVLELPKADIFFDFQEDFTKPKIFITHKTGAEMEAQYLFHIKNFIENGTLH